eukprot:Anaeramoba_ignava/a480685_11.p1 GENE.a480685_11~~a480685_11.p1  ORF type:complete len:655 (-),score=100.08 a480685_11:191-2155(-)
MEDYMANSKKKGQKGSLSIHTENIFPIIKKWLYSEHDIFLRELIANAVDALNKRKTVDSDVNEEDLKVQVKIDKDKGTIQVIDTGIGMTSEEVEKYINQIAFSGAEDFVEKFKDKQSAIIGHFGLGFYSSFMVAEKVTIDTLSWQKDSEPAFWECDGSTEYILNAGERKEVGTTITLHVSEDNKEYLDTAKLKEIIEKFCNFMPYPIELDRDVSFEENRLEEEKKEEKITEEEYNAKKAKLKVVNQTFALWNKKPSEVTDEEYKEFYKELFHDYQDPLFWIHLNVDYPFNLKGILYFPKIKNELDMHRGKVHLYCNNVFVAENLKDFIPEFLTLLRGGIDIPDIPLNVSRSFLQQDKQVNKITKYIIKKVADQLKNLFKEDREKYVELWEDIQQFIKFGALTNEDFFDAVKDVVIFKSSSRKWVTVEEYKENNPLPEKEKNEDEKEDENKAPDVLKIYYSQGEDSQLSYQKLMIDQGFEILFSNSPLDSHLFQQLELKHPGTMFVRIDSEVNDNLVDTENAEVVDADNKTESEKIIEIFKENLENKSLTVEAKMLKSDSVSAMIVFNEHMRRFQEMNQFMNTGDMGFMNNHTLMLNTGNKSVKKVLQLKALNKDDEVKTLCEFIYKLALIEQKKFTGKEMQDFVTIANSVLNII